VRILIEFDDKWAVILITFLTVVGWIVSFSLIYTTYYLSTGSDPLSWAVSWMPPWLYDSISFIGKNGGYFSVIISTIVGTIIAVIIWRGRKEKPKQAGATNALSPSTALWIVCRSALQSY
jgi:mannose/fructose/N-acetylgalactosamine-specific phosphotransferase system component IIC